MLDTEPIQVNIEETMTGMTIAAGYDLPKNLALVTRQILDYDETAGQRPACIIQQERVSGQLVGLGGVGQSTLSGRLVFYFDVDTGALAPATFANAYIKAARQALLQDRSRGANPNVLTTTVPDEPTALLWQIGQALEATLLYEVLCMHEGGV